MLTYNSKIEVCTARQKLWLSWIRGDEAQAGTAIEAHAGTWTEERRTAALALCSRLVSAVAHARRS